MLSGNVYCTCDSLLFIVSVIWSQTIPDYEYLRDMWVLSLNSIFPMSDGGSQTLSCLVIMLTGHGKTEAYYCFQYQIVGRKPSLIGRFICECDPLLFTVSGVGSQTLPDWEYLWGAWVFDSLMYIQYQILGRKPLLIGELFVSVTHYYSQCQILGRKPSLTGNIYGVHESLTHWCISSIR